MGRTRAQHERLTRDIEIVAAGLGTVGLAALARRTGRTPAGVRKLLERQHLAPTRDGGYITAATLAREYVALSPQAVAAKCRAGEIPARRNATHTCVASERRHGARNTGWWLIDIDHIPMLQARYGARGEPVRWRPGIRRWSHREAA